MQKIKKIPSPIIDNPQYRAIENDFKEKIYYPAVILQKCRLNLLYQYIDESIQKQTDSNKLLKQLQRKMKAHAERKYEQERNWLAHEVERAIYDFAEQRCSESTCETETFTLPYLPLLDENPGKAKVEIAKCSSHGYFRRYAALGFRKNPCEIEFILDTSQLSLTHLRSLYFYFTGLLSEGEEWQISDSLFTKLEDVAMGQSPGYFTQFPNQFFEQFYGVDGRKDKRSPNQLYLPKTFVQQLHTEIFQNELQLLLQNCTAGLENEIGELQRVESDLELIQLGGGSKINSEQCPYIDYPHKCDRKHWCVPPPGTPKGTTMGKQDRCIYTSAQLYDFFEERPTFRHSKSSPQFDPEETDMPIAFVPQIPVTSPIPSRGLRKPSPAVRKPSPRKPAVQRPTVSAVISTTIPQQDQWVIYVTAPSGGDVYEIIVNSDMTVLDLKKIISEKIGAPANRISLYVPGSYYGSTELKIDGNQITNYLTPNKEVTLDVVVSNSTSQHILGFLKGGIQTISSVVGGMVYIGKTVQGLLKPINPNVQQRLLNIMNANFELLGMIRDCCMERQNVIRKNLLEISKERIQVTQERIPAPQPRFVIPVKVPQRSSRSGRERLLKPARKVMKALDKMQKEIPEPEAKQWVMGRAYGTDIPPRRRDLRLLEDVPYTKEFKPAPRSQRVFPGKLARKLKREAKRIREIAEWEPKRALRPVRVGRVNMPAIPQQIEEVIPEVDIREMSVRMPPGIKPQKVTVQPLGELQAENERLQRQLEEEDAIYAELTRQTLLDDNECQKLLQETQKALKMCIKDEQTLKSLEIDVSNVQKCKEQQKRLKNELVQAQSDNDFLQNRSAEVQGAYQDECENTRALLKECQKTATNLTLVFELFPPDNITDAMTQEISIFLQAIVPKNNKKAVQVLQNFKKTINNANISKGAQIQATLEIVNALLNPSRGLIYL